MFSSCGSDYIREGYLHYSSGTTLTPSGSKNCLECEYRKEFFKKDKKKTGIFDRWYEIYKKVEEEGIKE